MADLKSKVFIGFEDELISDKYQSIVNYTTNKIGGKPDWIENKQVANPQCQLCGLTLPLVVQVYAPLEESHYHRTLYLFGCVNPNCWNQNDSWVCLRSQSLDAKVTESAPSEVTSKGFDWCENADNWEDEENGNVVTEVRNDQECVNKSVHLSRMMAGLEVEEMCSAGAACEPLTPTATAEIEADEGEDVTIDTPITAQVDMTALFDQVKPVPQVPSEALQFVSYFISVSEEEQTVLHSPPSKEFQCKFVDEESNTVMDHSEGVGNMQSMEKYEKTIPAHGDKLFHLFISRIQKNPGQIIRYIREGGDPLLLYEMKEREIPGSCCHCQGQLVWELQLLPTLLSSLQLGSSGSGHLEYGTVFVLACERSCWSPQDTFRSEYVLVQREI